MLLKKAHLFVGVMIIFWGILTFNLHQSTIITIAQATHYSHHSNTNSKLNSFLIVLKPQRSQLSNYATSLHPTFLTRNQFAKKYGQSKKYIHKLNNYFKHYHLKTVAYQGNLFLKVSGQKRHIEEALHFHLIKSKNKNAIIYKPNHKLFIKYSLQKHIQGFLLSSISGKMHTSLATINHKKGRSPQSFINRYHVKDIDTLRNQCKSSIGILSFGNFTLDDVQSFWKHMNINPDGRRIHVYKNMLHNRLKNSVETTMDIEQAGAINPQSEINVYLAKPTIFGMINNLAKAIADNKSDSLSLSWGISEVEIAQLIRLGIVPHNYNQMLNTILLQGAAQGISIFNASGDNGAYDGINNGFTDLSVETPASSPYITAVGATTLPIKYKIGNHWIVVNHERAWSNDFLYPLFNKLKLYNSRQQTFLSTYFVGTGGGFSKFNSTPQYQQGISGVGTYNAIKYWNMKHQIIKQYSKPRRNIGKAKGRNLPDLVANGDPQTGYSVYFRHHWMIDGGTSIVSPQIAAVSTLFVAKSNRRIGLFNPKIYSLAQSQDSPFNPINSDSQNSNLYFTGQSYRIYNQATGLGTVNFSKLYQKIQDNNY